MPPRPGGGPPLTRIEEVVATVDVSLNSLKLAGVRIAGLGSNLSCFGAILPREDNLGELAGHARRPRTRLGIVLCCFGKQIL